MTSSMSLRMLFGLIKKTKGKKTNILFILPLVTDFQKLLTALQAYFFTLFLINSMQVFKGKSPIQFEYTWTLNELVQKKLGWVLLFFYPKEYASRKLWVALVSLIWECIYNQAMWADRARCFGLVEGSRCPLIDIELCLSWRQTNIPNQCLADLSDSIKKASSFSPCLICQWIAMSAL